MKNFICWVLLALIFASCSDVNTPINPEPIPVILSHKIIKIVHKQNGTEIRSQAFSYNADGKIAKILVTSSGADSQYNAAYYYTYNSNEILRIHQVLHGVSDTSIYKLSNGRIINEMLIVNNQSQKINTYTYDSENKLSEIELNWGVETILFANNNLMRWDDHTSSISSEDLVRSFEYNDDTILNNCNIDLMQFILIDVTKVPIHLDITGKRSEHLPSKVSRYYDELLLYECFYQYKKNTDGYITELSWTESDVTGTNSIEFYYE